MFCRGFIPPFNFEKRVAPPAAANNSKGLPARKSATARIVGELIADSSASDVPSKISLMESVAPASPISINASRKVCFSVSAFFAIVSIAFAFSSAEYPTESTCSATSLSKRSKSCAKAVIQFLRQAPPRVSMMSDNTIESSGRSSVTSLMFFIICPNSRKVPLVSLT